MWRLSDMRSLGLRENPEFIRRSRASTRTDRSSTSTRTMFDEQENVIRYKWDAWTGSGYRIRCAIGGGEHHYFVEDWSNHVVVDDYGCHNLDEALGVLNRYCDIDVARERTRIAAWLPENVQ